MRTPIHTVYNGFNWFVLRVQGAQEAKAALNLELCGAAGQVPDYCLVKQLWIPHTTTTINSKGVTKVHKVVLTPGYIFVEALLSRSLHAALKAPDIPHVFGWLQRGGSWPSLVSLTEIRRLACLEEPAPVEEPDIIFNIGDKVTIPSMGVVGYVVNLSYLEMTLEVEVFSRKVPFKVRRTFFSEIVKL